MGAKEFLMPSIKKIVVFLVAYVIVMPLLFCINSEANCQQMPGWLGCSCASAFNTISLYPVQYFYLVSFGLFSFTGYFSLLWLGVLLSYLLACVIVYFWWSGSDN